MALRYNRGEWSELYAFLRLLRDGRIYAADSGAKRIDDQFLPIIRIIRAEGPDKRIDYYTGEKIRLYKNGAFASELDPSSLDPVIDSLFSSIFGAAAGEGAFEIPSVQSFMERLGVTKVKANSSEKVDIEMQVHDLRTGFSPVVGFSVKSDVGSPPTLLNSGKNTRFRFRVEGLSDEQMLEVNAIDKTVCREYMKARFERLLQFTGDVEYDSMVDRTFEDNLILIDSMLPRIYGEMILHHYMRISDGVYRCAELVDLVAERNPLKYRRNDVYAVKFKKLLTAAALGMTPGKVWDGRESATGGYVIIKRDGDVLFYHLYNRNFFEDYLMENTRFDRPSPSRHDFGYVFDAQGRKFIDLNVQVRFRTIG